ncbi:MAG: hypothetical protein ACLTDS_07185 [Bianqueaceae bacterium]
MIVMGTFAYALSRQQFQLRKAFSIVMLIPMLFSEGCWPVIWSTPSSIT